MVNLSALEDQMEKGTTVHERGGKKTNNQGKIKGRKITISSKAEYFGEVPENPMLLIKRKQLTLVSYHLVFRWKNKSQYLRCSQHQRKQESNLNCDSRIILLPCAL